MIKKLMETGKKLSFNSSTHSHSSISFSIVNTEGNGKRVKLSGGLMEKLGNPKSVCFVVNEDQTGIFIFESEDNGVHVGKGNVIYNASLVENLTTAFNIDFSKHTSHSFSNITIQNDSEDDITYAEIILTE